MSSKRRRQRQRAAAAASPRPYHPEPFYETTCRALGVPVSQVDEPHDGYVPRFYDPEVWPPTDFWVSDLGNVFEWDGEHYVPIMPDADPVPEHLIEQIKESIRAGDPVWFRGRRLAPRGRGQATHHVEGFTPYTVTLHTMLSEDEREERLRAHFEQMGTDL